jgi:hypothetical protein
MLPKNGLETNLWVAKYCGGKRNSVEVEKEKLTEIEREEKGELKRWNNLVINSVIRQFEMSPTKARYPKFAANDAWAWMSPPPEARVVAKIPLVRNR